MSHSAQSRRAESKSYEEFTRRVIDAVRAVLAEVIDQTIASLPGRMEIVVKGKGERIKYWTHTYCSFEGTFIMIFIAGYLTYLILWQ